MTRTAQSIEDALASINENEFPVSMEDREKFCMEQLSTGEALFTQGNEQSTLVAATLDFMENKRAYHDALILYCPQALQDMMHLQFASTRH